MVAIKDMEIPSSCINCDIRSGSYCYAKNKPPYNIIGNLLTRDDNCPLVEIEERKVGRWIKSGGSFRCSECVSMPEFTDIRRLKYCPNCGAEMRGINAKRI